MIKDHKSRLGLLFLFTIYSSGAGDRTKDKIYYESGVVSGCFRRLNATHQIGCSSSRGGNVGVLHYVESQSDVTWLIENGPHKPYVVLLTPQMFNQDIVKQLDKSGKINGLLVISSNDTDLPQYFSPDSTCPNSNFELYKNDPEFASCKKNVWNPQGNSMLMEDIDFPILAMRNYTDVEFFIHECYEKFNKPQGNKTKTYPLCGAQVKDAMDAIKDTPTCLRRGEPRNFNPQTYCEPLGDKNVYSFLHPIKYTNSADFEDTLMNGSVIVAAARLDAAGLFEYLYPAADTTVVGFISLLAAAEALGRVKDTMDPDTDKPIMFSFFQGETFDYMGSTQMLHEMKQGDFPYTVPEGAEGPHPIKLNHLGNFVEVSQVALPEGNTMWVHSDPRSRRVEDISKQVSEIEETLARYGAVAGLDFQATSSQLPLPPSSLQSFLKELNVSGVVLADHNSSYNNRFYNSRLDLYSNVNYNLTMNTTSKAAQFEVTALSEHLTNVAKVIANTLYNMSTGRSAPDGPIAVNQSIVTQLLYCFFISPQCELFNFTMSETDAKDLQEGPYDFYVGIYRLGSPITSHTFQLMSYFTGNVMHGNNTKEACDKLKSPYFQYVWMQGPINSSDSKQTRVGLCMETTANKSLAKSPAFEDGYDYSSNDYGAWTESVWPHGTPSVRVFLIPDRSYEIMTLCIGLAVIIVSLPLVYITHRRSLLLFHTD